MRGMVAYHNTNIYYFRDDVKTYLRPFTSALCLLVPFHKTDLDFFRLAIGLESPGLLRERILGLNCGLTGISEGMQWFAGQPCPHRVGEATRLRRNSGSPYPSAWQKYYQNPGGRSRDSGG